MSSFDYDSNINKLALSLQPLGLRKDYGKNPKETTMIKPLDYDSPHIPEQMEKTLEHESIPAESVAPPHMSLVGCREPLSCPECGSRGDFDPSIMDDVVVTQKPQIICPNCQYKVPLQSLTRTADGEWVVIDPSPDMQEAMLSFKNGTKKLAAIEPAPVEDPKSSTELIQEKLAHLASRLAYYASKDKRVTVNDETQVSED